MSEWAREERDEGASVNGLHEPGGGEKLGALDAPAPGEVRVGD